MAGAKKHSKELLNKTLHFIAQLFIQHDIQNWFISYGTLLGIMRDNSCIDKDDDVDIMCDINEYDKIKDVLIQNKFKFEIIKPKIIKTHNSNDYTSIDFYMADVNEKGDFDDKWNGVVWSECFSEGKLISLEWNGVTLYIPKDYETKFVRRYGSEWKIPQNTKGPLPHKKVL